MKLKINGDKVPYLYEEGKDTVKATMDASVAQKIVNKGKVSQSKKHPGYPLCVNGKFYFQGVKEKPEKKPQEE